MSEKTKDQVLKEINQGYEALIKEIPETNVEELKMFLSVLPDVTNMLDKLKEIIEQELVKR